MEQAVQLPIIYISPYYDPKVPSGANRRFDEIGQRLMTEFGDRFTLIVTKGKCPAWWTGKNLHEVDYHFDNPSKFTAAHQIGRILDELPPSIVLMESIPAPLRALKRHRHFQIAYDFRHLHAAGKPPVRHWLFSNYLKYQWGHAEFMVTCSDFSINELVDMVGYDRKRVLKSYFGIAKEILERADPNAQKDLDLFYAAHFEPRKNHGPLLEAIALVDKNLRALLVGVDNGLRPALEAQAKTLGLVNVEFGIIKDDNKLWDAYRRTKLYVFPSIYEGFGMPLIEALAMNVPVACSDISVFHEIGGNVVIYFDPRSPQDIADKLRGALANPKPLDRTVVLEQLEPFIWDNIYTTFVKDINDMVTRFEPRHRPWTDRPGN